MLIVAGEEPSLSHYLLKVYSRILQNQPLEDAARAETDGPEVRLVCGEGANHLLQFDGFIEKISRPKPMRPIMNIPATTRS